MTHTHFFFFFYKQLGFLWVLWFLTTCQNASVWIVYGKLLTFVQGAPPGCIPTLRPVSKDPHDPDQAEDERMNKQPSDLWLWDLAGFTVVFHE